MEEVLISPAISRSIWKVMDIAFNLLTTVLLGAFVGYQVDLRRNTDFPLGVIVGTILGMVIGMYSVYKRYIR